MIDKISFRFRMADEMFARNLYADWDGFCRHCVTDILEEFFAAYDDMETCLEIPTLELDLGSIPQERFLEVFLSGSAKSWKRNSCHIRKFYGRIFRSLSRPEMPVQDVLKTCCIIWSTVSACRNGKGRTSTCMKNSASTWIWGTETGCSP